MTEFMDDLGLSTVERNLVVSVAVIVVLIALRAIVAMLLRRRISEPEAKNRSQKWVTYATTTVVVIALVNIWARRRTKGCWPGWASCPPVSPSPSPTC